MMLLVTGLALGSLGYLICATAASGASSRWRYRSRRIVGGPATMTSWWCPANRCVQMILSRSPSPDGATRPSCPGAPGPAGRASVEQPSTLASVNVEHEPRPLRDAGLVHCDETLLARARLSGTPEPPLVHYAEGVNARLGSLH
jgi:hypothetical protein